MHRDNLVLTGSAKPHSSVAAAALQG